MYVLGPSVALCRDRAHPAREMVRLAVRAADLEQPVADNGPLGHLGEPAQKAQAALREATHAKVAEAGAGYPQSTAQQDHRGAYAAVVYAVQVCGYGRRVVPGQKLSENLHLIEHQEEGRGARRPASGLCPAP